MVSEMIHVDLMEASVRHRYSRDQQKGEKITSTQAPLKLLVHPPNGKNIPSHTFLQQAADETLLSR